MYCAPKGSVVATVPPDAPGVVIPALMAKRRVGAVVVVDDSAVAGKVGDGPHPPSARTRASLVNAPISVIMNAEVISSLPTDEVDGVLRIMPTDGISSPR
jgi:CBS domain-containing protein